MIGHLLIPASHWWQRHLLLHLEAPTAEEIIALHELAQAEMRPEVRLVFGPCDEIQAPSKPWTLLRPRVVNMSKNSAAHT